MCPVCLSHPWGNGRLSNCREHLARGACQHRLLRLAIASTESGSLCPNGGLWRHEDGSVTVARIVPGEGRRWQRMYCRDFVTFAEASDAEAEWTKILAEVEMNVGTSTTLTGDAAVSFARDWPIWNDDAVQHTETDGSIDPAKVNSASSQDVKPVVTADSPSSVSVKKEPTYDHATSTVDPSDIVPIVHDTAKISEPNHPDIPQLPVTKLTLAPNAPDQWGPLFGQHSPLASIAQTSSEPSETPSTNFANIASVLAGLMIEERTPSVSPTEPFPKGGLTDSEVCKEFDPWSLDDGPFFEPDSSSLSATLHGLL